MPIYRKKKDTGAHYMRIGGSGLKRINDGETIEVQKYVLGGALDKFEELGPAPGDLPESPGKLAFRLEASPGGWYHVVNAVTGKPIHDKAMRKQQAEDLIASENLQIVEIAGTDNDGDTMRRSAAEAAFVSGSSGDGK